MNTGARHSLIGAAMDSGRPADIQIVIGAEVIYWVVIAAALTPIVTALVHDATTRRWFWLFFGILFPPIALIRGVVVWLKSPQG